MGIIIARFMSPHRTLHTRTRLVLDAINDTPTMRKQSESHLYIVEAVTTTEGSSNKFPRYQVVIHCNVWEVNTRNIFPFATQISRPSKTHIF